MVVVEHTNGNQQPKTNESYNSKNPNNNLRPSAKNLRSSAVKQRGGWGGRRPGAGAPKGNLNGFKHGRRSRQLADAVMTMAANPKVRDTLVALNNRAGQKQAKAEDVGMRVFVNIMTKGIKIENAEQARAITDLIREMTK